MKVKIVPLIVLTFLGAILSGILKDWQIGCGFACIILLTIIIERVKYKLRRKGITADLRNVPYLVNSSEGMNSIPTFKAGEEVVYIPDENATCGHNFKYKWPQRDNLHPGQKYTITSVNSWNGLITIQHTYGPGYYQHPSQFVKSGK